MVVGVQFQGRSNQFSTNVKTDDCAEVIDDTVSLSQKPNKYKVFHNPDSIIPHSIFTPKEHSQHLLMHCNN